MKKRLFMLMTMVMLAFTSAVAYPNCHVDKNLDGEVCYQEADNSSVTFEVTAIEDVAIFDQGFYICSIDVGNSATLKMVTDYEITGEVIYNSLMDAETMQTYYFNYDLGLQLVYYKEMCKPDYNKDFKPIRYLRRC